MFHAGAGTIGMLSGFTALAVRKGSRPHRTAGNVFVVAMLATGLTAAYLGFVIDNIASGLGGVLTAYLLATAWMTAKRRDNESGLFEIGALAFVTAGLVAGVYAIAQSLMNGAPFSASIPPIIFNVFVALLAAGDLSVVLRRGVSGRQRVARHLWRMLLGLAIAVGSFFPGQLQFFPDFIQNIRPTILLFIPLFAILALMAFWLIRVLFTRWWRDDAHDAEPAAQEATS